MNNYDTAKKLLGETVARIIRNKLPYCLEHVDNFIPFLVNLVPCKEDYAKVLTELSAKVEDSFKDSFQVDHKVTKVLATPQELLSKVDYIFHIVTTKEQFLTFKKDFRSNELLCSFNGIESRLRDNHVFWLRHKDADNIQPFSNPRRQDAYGTSSMSVQINRTNGQISIKNRYNHTVDNCDATHGNDLNNIIDGLSDAVFALPNMPKKSKQKSSLPSGFTSDNKGCIFCYDREIDAVYLSKHGYLKGGVIYSIDKAYQRMYDDYLIDAKAKTALSITSGKSLI